MSETQIIKPVNPSMRVSTMDSHRLLTHPDATPPRTGTQRPNKILLGGGQPERSTAPDMLLKNTPIEAIMGGGGAVQVKAPNNPARARQMPRPELAAQLTRVSNTSTETIVENTSPSIALNEDQIALCTIVVDDYIARNSDMPDHEIVLARATLATLVEMTK